MSVAPHAGIIDFGTFTPPTASLDGIQGEVPQPLIGQEAYVLTAVGWAAGTSVFDPASPGPIGNTTPDTGTFTTLTANSTLQFGRGSANYGQGTGGATTQAVEFRALGSDTNVALALRTQGTGAIDLAAGSRGVNISNGGTVTAITRTANGSGYTSNPTVTIAAPTTAGGVQATATVNIATSGTPTVSSGGTGYTVGDVLFIVGGTPVSVAATLTVTTVSGGVITAATYTNFAPYTAAPSNPVSVTGGTGTGATFTVLWGISATFTITNAGSGYVEQPTVTFSGGGGGTGAAAYASVGAGTIIRSLGSTGTQSLSLYTPNGEAVRIRDIGGADSYMMIQPASGLINFIAQGGTNAALNFNSNGTGVIAFNTAGTSGTTQFRISHTASAVNYVQVTGGATTVSPTISSQGSDTNLDLRLTPKGTGLVRFGTYTGTVLAIAGYVEIKDSGGTTRRLAVVA